MKLSTIPKHFSPEIEDRLAYLHLFDTVFLIDDSSSMKTADSPEKPTRWIEAQEMLAILAQIAARHDEDGIDIHFLNNTKSFKGLKTISEVAQVFQKVQTSGGTPTATKLDKILAEYFTQLKSAHGQKRHWFKRQKPVKPLNLVVITDGRPFPETEEPDEVIRKYMTKLDELDIPKNKRQVGIMFAQVGKDQSATDALQRLDDMAKGNERDMVDTFNCNLSDIADDDIDSLAKLLLGAIVPEIDVLLHAKISSSSDSTQIVHWQVAASSSTAPQLPPAYDNCGGQDTSVSNSKDEQKP